MSDRPRWERWILAVDVPADTATGPAIIVRHVLKRLWRTFGVKCRGFSEDRRIFEQQQEIARLRKIIAESHQNAQAQRSDGEPARTSAESGGAK